MRKLWKWLTGKYSDYHDLIEIGVISFLANVAYGILNVSAIQPYAKSVGWTGELGVIYATYLVAEALARSPMGAIGDRIGRKTMFIGASIVGAVTSFLWSVIPVLWIILIVHAFDGFTFAAFYAATVVAMTEAVGKEKRTAAMTVFIITLMGGMSVGPVIGGFANEWTHSELTSFWVSSAVFIGTALVAAYYFPKRIQKSEEEAEKKGDKVSLLSAIWSMIKTVPGYLLLAVLIFFPAGLIIPIVKLFAMAVFNFTEGEFGVAFVAGAVAVGILSFGTSWLSKKWGNGRAVQAGLTVGAVSAFLFVLLKGHLWWDLIFAGGIGLGYVITIPAWMALYTDLAAPEVRGTVVGVMGLGQGIGLIAGVVLGGYFYHSVPISFDGIHLSRYYTPFFAMTLGLAAAAVLAFIFVKERPEQVVTGEEKDES